MSVSERWWSFSKFVQPFYSFKHFQYQLQGELYKLLCQGGWPSASAIAQAGPGHLSSQLHVPCLLTTLTHHPSFLSGEDPLVDDQNERDINSVAGVLKLYFRGLENPLFPKERFQDLISTISKYFVSGLIIPWEIFIEAAVWVRHCAWHTGGILGKQQCGLCPHWTWSLVYNGRANRHGTPLWMDEAQKRRGGGDLVSQIAAGKAWCEQGLMGEVDTGNPGKSLGTHRPMGQAEACPGQCMM